MPFQHKPGKSLYLAPTN